MTDPATALQGSWRLASFETELQDSAERSRPFGDAPRGALVFSPAGRMMALITAQSREPGRTDEQLAALFRTLMAYTGRYRAEDGRLVIEIDACWNEAWNGSAQERFYALAGDTLDIVSAWMPNPLVPGSPMARGVLRFERE